MAKILKIITADERERYIKWRLNAPARKLSMISRNRVRGSIAQTAERTSHKGERGGSIPPRAIRGER